MKIFNFISRIFLLITLFFSSVVLASNSLNPVGSLDPKEFEEKENARPVKIHKGKKGMYWAKYDTAGGSTILIYHVDAIAELCFATYFVYGITTSSSGGGITEFSCKKLTKRKEWKDIITWIE